VVEHVDVKVKLQNHLTMCAIADSEPFCSEIPSLRGAMSNVCPGEKCSGSNFLLANVWDTLALLLFLDLMVDSIMSTWV